MLVGFYLIKHFYTKKSSTFPYMSWQNFFENVPARYHKKHNCSLVSESCATLELNNIFGTWKSSKESIFWGKF